MSKRQRDRFYPLVMMREIHLNLEPPYRNIGPYCRGCGIEVRKDKGVMDAFGTEYPQGIIDCVDNSDDHTKLKNLQLLCRSCNAIKNPSRPDHKNRDTMSFSEKTNERAKKKFRQFAIKTLLDHNGQYDYDDMVASGAEICDVETVTIERYMKRLKSSYGPFDVVDGTVYWKSDKDLEKWMSITEEEERITA